VSDLQKEIHKETGKMQRAQAELRELEKELAVQSYALTDMQKRQKKPDKETLEKSPSRDNVRYNFRSGLTNIR
jgi:hypothetical protein